MGAISI